MNIDENLSEPKITIEEIQYFIQESHRSSYSNNSGSVVSDNVNQVSILPYQDFKKLKNPLDVLEEFYIPFQKAYEYYGKNDLRGPMPAFNKKHYNQIIDIKLQDIVFIIRFNFIISLIKIIISPFTMCIDLCVLKSILSLNKSGSFANSCILPIVFGIRLIFGILVLSWSSSVLGFLIGAWIIFGGLIEIIQVVLFCKQYQDIKDLRELEIDIIRSESFKGICYLKE